MIKKALPLIVYFLVTSLSLFHFIEPGYFLALDMQWGPNTFSEFHFDELYGNTINPYGAYLPLFLVFSALSQFVSVEILQKVFLFMIMLFSGLSAHFSLPKKLGHSRYAAGFFYMLNPFFLIRFLAGHWAVLLSYAALPLAITLFSRLMEKPKDRKLFALTLLITFISSVSSHMLAILLLSYVVVLAFFLIFRAKSYRGPLKAALLLGLCIAAINLFWALPVLIKFNTIYSPASADAYLEDFGALGKDMPLGLSLFTLHGFWRPTFMMTKDFFGFWYVPFAFLAAVSASGIFSLVKNRAAKALTLVTLFLVSFLLAMGDSSPISFVFNILGDTLPVYFFFRDSQKFVALMAFVYSASIAYGTHFLGERFGRAVLAIVLLAILFSNLGSIGLGGQILPTQYPESWAAANSIIANDTHDSNIVVFPLHLYRTYHWSNSIQQVLASPASQYFSKRVVTAANLETSNIYSDRVDPRGYYLGSMFFKRDAINNTAEMLIPLNGRYVLLFKDDLDTPHYLYMFMRHSGVPDMELVYECDEFYLFRNNLETAFIFSLDNESGSTFKSAYTEGVDSGKVEYVRKNPARYEILSSENELVVLARPVSEFITYDGAAFSSRYVVAGEAEYSGPGMVENSIFPLTLLLIYIYWMILLLALSGFSPRTLALAPVPAIVLYLVYDGVLGPSALGFLLIISVIALAGFAVLRNRLKW